ncbi:DUF4118 domain-containing protein [Kribbella sp. NPDC058245]|uniref:GAF domain-containing sensor histidine kinase n=1 Tax=Kribbella sp. NPDC058245 TaxID=3346399 RepID=UPI0036EBB3BC
MERSRLDPRSTSWLRGLVACVVLVAVVTGVVALLRPYVPVLSLLVLYLLAVLPVAVMWGARLAAVTSVVSVAAFTFLVPQQRSAVTADSRNLVALGVFLVTSFLVAELAARSRRAALESERLTEEQSALRRVATLVAESDAPAAVFEAVSREVGLLCGADLARLERYEEDGTVTGVGAWSRVPGRLVVGTRIELDGLSVAGEVLKTGRPVRLDSFVGATGAIAEEARGLGIRSSVGGPILVAGKVWGVIAASTRSDQPFAASTEAQIAGFTELVATAIANAESRAQLKASRARVVAAGDEMRRRLERDLHDGAQQRLVSLALVLRLAQAGVPAHLPMLRADIGNAAEELTEVVDDLRELARGIHPSVLVEGGLGPALQTLTRRSAVPVDLTVATRSRYATALEVATYYVVSEALTNAAKHARASRAVVSLEERDDSLRLTVRDDGAGGAEARGGSGLVGLHDRVESLGGSILVVSPVGQGTAIHVSLPLNRDGNTT